jgi:hypothetical protein
VIEYGHNAGPDVGGHNEDGQADESDEHNVFEHPLAFFALRRV